MPERQLVRAARRLLKSSPRPAHAPTTGRLLNLQPLRGLLAVGLRSQVRKQIHEGHYPAPFALIEHWRHNGANRKRLSALIFSRQDTKIARAAAMAARAAGFHTDEQEPWTLEDHPPLEACLERVREADVLLVAAAHRYGWIPQDAQRNPDGKSIGWLACQQAEANARQVLALVVDDAADWPGDLRDAADLTRAMELYDDEAADALIRSTRRRVKGLKAFKQWLDAQDLRRACGAKEGTKQQIEQALYDWQTRHVREGIVDADGKRRDQLLARSSLLLGRRLDKAGFYHVSFQEFPALEQEYEMVWFPGDDLLAACRPRGLPIGNLTSQFWSNCYLHPLDKFIKRELGCRAYLRYVDGMALVAESNAQLWSWKRSIVERLADLRLTVHEGSAQVVAVDTGIPWLGFVVYPTYRRVKGRKVV